MLGQMTLFQPDKTLPLRQRVSVEIVTLSQVRDILERFHYLHRVRVGRQINYAVIIDGVIDGVITYAYPMCIGKIAGISTNEIIEFARLYLHSNILHTATCAIGKSIKRISNDWCLLFPDSKPPKMIVSWSDATIHKGTIYKAANFEHLHRSKPRHKTLTGWPGRSKDTLEHDDYIHEKDCWIYKLG